MGESSNSQEMEDSQKTSDETDDFSSIWSSPLITITVGPVAKPFNCHSDVLCTIPFFRKCLNSGLSETTTSSIALPEDTPAAFSVVLSWIYRQKVMTINSWKDLRNHIEAYILADKLCMEALCNEIVDAVKLYHRVKRIDCDTFKHVRGKTIPECQLKWFLVEQQAWEIHDRGLEDLCECTKRSDAMRGEVEDKRCDLCSFIAGGGEDLLKIVRLMSRAVKDGEDSWGDPAFGPQCTFHVHKETPGCKPDKEGVKDED